MPTQRRTEPEVRSQVAAPETRTADTKSLFKKARRLYQRKKWDEAREAYEGMRSATTDAKVIEKIESALRLIEEKKRLPGQLGIWGLGLVVLPPLAFFPLGWLFDAIGVEVIPLYMSIMSVAFIIGFICAFLGLITQRGKLNKIAGGVTLILAVGFTAMWAQVGTSKGDRYAVHTGFALSGAAKMAVFEYFSANGTMPTSNREAGLAAPQEFSDQHVESVTIGPEGAITVTYKTGKFDGLTLIQTPQGNADGSILWDCYGGTVPHKFRSPDCREPRAGGVQPARTISTAEPRPPASEAPAPNENLWDKAVAAIDAGDYATALEPATVFANDGNAYMQYMVGFILVHGKGGVPADPETGLEWLRKAVDGGEQNATYTIAHMYKNGNGVPQDLEVYFNSVLDLAHVGLVRAQNEVGYAYAAGIGTSADVNEAFYWFDRAATAEHPIAMRNLGIAYENGQGTTKDSDKARTWYEKAAAAGDAEAAQLLNALSAP